MNKSFFPIIFAIMLCTDAAAQDFSVSHLSNNHTIVRILRDGRYVLLPVQESSPASELKLLAETKPVKSITVNPAIDKVDYFVPLEIEEWKGGHLLMDVILKKTTGGQNNSGDYLFWSEIRISDDFDRTDTGKFRPMYHFSPDYGWMNDPNGMFYKDGRWHLYFQYNPYGNIWGNMTWGHAVSDDLVNWKQVGNAIEPDALGMIYSGSAVVDEKNVAGFGKDAVVAMYTSAGVNQTQSIAWSNDGGNTFNKYGGNPVIVSDIRNFRDPKLFFDKKSGAWKTVIAAGDHLQFYSSDNLKDWKFDSSFGKGYGCHDGVWECPDLVELDFEGGSKWVLIVNISPGGPSGGSATQYFIGNYDGRSFVPDEGPEVTRWMDYGKDHYAAVTWSGAPDNRTVALAWMSNWQYAKVVPTSRFRSANSIPRDLSLVRKDGDIILKCEPSVELESLRGPAESRFTKKSIRLFDTPHKAYEMILSFDMKKKETASFALANSAGEQVLMRYDSKSQTFSMDRNSSGDVSFNKNFPAVTVAPARVGGKMKLRLFIDACSIEAFGDDFCMTNLVFPSSPYDSLRLSGDLEVNITLYPYYK